MAVPIKTYTIKIRSSEPDTDLVSDEVIDLRESLEDDDFRETLEEITEEILKELNSPENVYVLVTES